MKYRYRITIGNWLMIWPVYIESNEETAQEALKNSAYKNYKKIYFSTREELT